MTLIMIPQLKLPHGLHCLKVCDMSLCRTVSCRIWKDGGCKEFLGVTTLGTVTRLLTPEFMMNDSRTIEFEGNSRSFSCLRWVYLRGTGPGSCYPRGFLSAPCLLFRRGQAGAMVDGACRGVLTLCTWPPAPGSSLQSLPASPHVRKHVTLHEKKTHRVSNLPVRGASVLRPATSTNKQTSHEIVLPC